VNKIIKNKFKILIDVSKTEKKTKLLLDSKINLELLARFNVVIKTRINSKILNNFNRKLIEKKTIEKRVNIINFFINTTPT
jgi:hypothetical protein